MARIIFLKFLISFITISSMYGVAWNVLCQDKAVPQADANQTLTFKMFIHSRGATPEGALLADHVYLASDGEKIYRRGRAYPSSARANEELEQQLKGAINILERKPVMEKKRQVGERVVALFPNDTGGEKVLILRTYNMVLVSIEAPSLRHALAFEKFNER